MGIFDAPGLSQAQIWHAVNEGSALRTMTDLQRQNYTPQIKEIVYAIDTNLRYVGDGATVGGVFSATGLSEEQLLRLRFITPRHRYFLGRYQNRTAGVGAVAYGNSIIQGTGASSNSTNLLSRLGIKLQTTSGIDTNGAWTPSNRGVGGSVLYTPLTYASDSLEAPGVAQAGLKRVANAPYAVFMSCRNEAANNLSVTNYALLLRTGLRQLLRDHDDVLLVSEPPLINATTGQLQDGTTWAALQKVARATAADLGVSFVDVWAWWNWEYEQGVDLRTRMSSDGIHPNDIGHDMIAQLIYECLLAPPSSEPVIPFRSGTASAAQSVLVSSYDASVASAAPVSLTGYATSSTARRDQKVEGSSATVYSLSNGQSVTFHCPLPAYGLIVQLVQGSSGTGSVYYNGVSLGTVANTSTATVIEIASYFGITTPAAGELVITSTNASNPLKILGVTWLTAEPTDQHSTWNNKTESGTWSDTTLAGAGLANSVAARSSSTVGDYTDFIWYGTQFTYAAEAGTAQGQVTESTDGGAPTTYDLYSASTKNVFKTTAQLSEGWHTTRITVAAKNASSSANTVKVGLNKACLNPTSSIAYVTLGNGETMKLFGKWRLATVERALSGTPYVSGWVPYASSIALAGTGSAIVRLER